MFQESFEFVRNRTTEMTGINQKTKNKKAPIAQYP